MSTRTEDDERRIGRRTALKATAGAAASTLALSAGAGAQQSDEPDYGGWFDDVSNYDETVDMTGQDSVTVEVGVDANGGTWGFGPPAVRVDPGTAVTFEWVSDTHNVAIEEQPGGAGWEGHAPIENTGFSFEHTFETEGLYKYFCEPHLSVGMKAAIVVGDVGGGDGGPVSEPDYDGWFDDVGNYDETVDSRGQDTVTVEVGVDANGGTWGFGPPAVRVDPGTTVTFEWVSDTHNVAIEEQPGGAGWEGHAPIENTGFSFEHTFETEGLYKYFCEPHLSVGMKAAIVVGNVGGGGDGGPAPGDGAGGDGGGQPIELPGGEVGFGILGTMFALTGLGALAVLGAELYGAARRSRGSEAAAETETEPEIVREIDHDEFDPVGTLALITIYFLILVGMWILVYFVEFLGRTGIVTG